MRHLNFISRLITVLCYFLPFVFFYSGCNGLSLETVYNRKDVFNIVTNSNETIIAVSQDTLHNKTPELISDSIKHLPETAKDSLISEALKGNAEKKDFLARILFPANHSLSAIGVLFIYKTTFGRITIGISIGISLFLLLGIKLVKRKEKLQQWLSAVNVVCVIWFIVEGYINKVDILWGAWGLFCGVFISLLTQKASVNKDQTNRLQ